MTWRVVPEAVTTQLVRTPAVSMSAISLVVPKPRIPPESRTKELAMCVVSVSEAPWASRVNCTVIQPMELVFFVYADRSTMLMVDPVLVVMSSCP